MNRQTRREWVGVTVIESQVRQTTYLVTEVWEEPPPAFLGRTGENVWPLNFAETPSCQLSINKDTASQWGVIWLALIKESTLWHDLYNIMSIRLPHTYTVIKPFDSSLLYFSSFPFLCWFFPSPKTFSVFLLPSCFHLQLFSPLLCSITMSHRTLGQREAEHSTSPCSLSHHILCSQESQPSVVSQQSVAELAKWVGVKKVAGFETINVRYVTQEGS